MNSQETNGQVKPGLPVRYTPPSKYDLAEFGETVDVMTEEGKYSTYIQLSTNAEVSCWLKIGDFWAIVLDDKPQDRGFMKTCLSLYLEKTKPVEGV
jgi:hypothetical protein